MPRDEIGPKPQALNPTRRLLLVVGRVGQAKCFHRHIHLPQMQTARFRV